MIKIERITLRIRGGKPLDVHQGVRLARAVGESLAGTPAERPTNIESNLGRIGLTQPAPPLPQPEALGSRIGGRILSRITRR